MSVVRVVAVADNFGRDVGAGFALVERILDHTRAVGARLVVFPEATLGGYLAHLDPSGPPDLPPAFDPAGPEIAELGRLAGELVVCAGYCEGDGAARYNAAVCVSGDGVLGHHRKVHHPLSEGVSYDSGDRFRPFDTPVGRLGMMICYDKAFPEAARALALDGAEIVACLSAWPASRTDPAPVLAEDRWTRRFDLFDQARALENQVVWVSANQSGTFGTLQFVGRAKVVGPGGEILAATGTTAGLAMADVDVAGSMAEARRVMCHLRDRRPDAYEVAAVAQ
ncbi:MAG: carbon-nitrogen hydrolase family protein [Actinomycetota bacterium]|nr:carbon-nitrogen hydrolase family protein [Actinomycetota bacterium]